MRTRLKDIAIPLASALCLLSPTFFMHSCANTTQAPTGGAKDTIPPALYWTKPEPGATNVDTAKTHLEFGFDEYVTIKNQQNIFLSPPQKKRQRPK